jgi:hypothetical protein
MARKSVKVEAGLTHAERVKELDRSKEFESSIVTLSSMPSKYNALPTLPAVHKGPFTKVPAFPFPEESEAVVSLPSSNFQCATRPGLTVNDALASVLGLYPLLKAFALTVALLVRVMVPVYRVDD